MRPVVIVVPSSRHYERRGYLVANFPQHN